MGKFLRIFYVGLLTILTVSCLDKTLKLEPGLWRLTLQGESVEIPALLEVKDQENIFLIRGKEKIKLDSMSKSNDNVIILGMHIYDSELVIEEITRGNAKGYWNRLDKTPVQKIPFKLTLGKSSFFDGEAKATTFSLQGKWKWVFDPGTEKETQDLGIFTQVNGEIYGSIATPTGDYGLIQGSINDKIIRLATFDGGFAFVIEAQFEDEKTLKGNLLTLNSSRPFTAYLDEKHQLPDATQPTKAKNSLPVEISLPSVLVSGQNISLKDDRYKNKPVILQVYGSWCPNCLDEVRFLSEWYKNNKGPHKEQVVEILGIAFERAGTVEGSKRNILKSIHKFNIEYEFVLAAVDKNTKPDQVLPIDNFISFPTTIFLDKSHKIKKIHAGFSGPATGEEYDKFIKFFHETIEKLKK